MKRQASLFIIALLCGALVHAGVSPLAGFYVSQELDDDGVPNDGVVLDGRWSEAYPNGQPGEVGSAIQAASWDSTNLSAMWEVGDLTLQSVMAIGGPVSMTPNWYQQTYQTTYSGGTMVLENTGPWWNSADNGAYTEYALTVDSYIHTTVKDFRDDGSGFVETGFTTTIALTATFDENPNASITFFVAAAIPTGYGTTPPSGYPDFAISADGGAWGKVQKIRMEIVPEPATLAILGLGGLTLLRRRR
ncbi:MAG: PEP-CTERM sorting domain-containing protein [Planctomycetota bacterium]|jgi:hypothetical protein